jgi:hypothetical protein
MHEFRDRQAVQALLHHRGARGAPRAIAEMGTGAAEEHDPPHARGGERARERAPDLVFALVKVGRAAVERDHEEGAVDRREGPAQRVGIIE